MRKNETVLTISLRIIEQDVLRERELNVNVIISSLVCDHKSLSKTVENGR